jgi:oligoendopeptidase F
MSMIVAGQERERAAVADVYKWDLTDLYVSDEAWRDARDAFAVDVSRVRAFAGRLGESPAVLADALETTFDLSRGLGRLWAYAGMRGDEDTRLADPRAMQQELEQVAAGYGAEVAYLEPEILALGRETLEAFVAAEPRLQAVRFYLDDIVRRAAHTLSDREERILAAAAPLAGAPSNVYGILANADFPYPQVTLSDGSAARVNQAGYADLRTRDNRDDRHLATSAFFGALGEFNRTFGTTINGSVQKALFYAKARGYDSSLAMRLDAANIPRSVYQRLIEGVRRHLPALHRYLGLRKRMMGIVGDLHYYDLYAPLVAQVKLTYTPEEAQALVQEAMMPLGAEYVAVLAQAFEDRWIDFFPTPGKRSGAYSQGSAYDVHPYILMNFQGQYNDVSTLAHELGHTMHSYYSNRAQPFALADYPIFVAEVASTFNEDLLIEHLLARVEDAPTRLSLLGSYLENVKATVFRQTQFSDFELRMHEMAQRGEALTGEALSRLYLDITREYYGHDAGVLVVDDYVAHEWSYIPHFYSEFYVYQYATSFAASAALAEKVRTSGAEARDRYLAFLASGGSGYPIDLLRKAGVDMATDEPLDLTVAKMHRVMDEIQALLR